MVRLVPVDGPPEKRRLGIWDGRIRLANDWDSDEVNEEITGMFLGEEPEEGSFSTPRLHLGTRVVLPPQQASRQGAEGPS